MVNLQRNLHSLKAEFRDKGDAAKGHKTLMKFIESNQDKELAYLLRNHEEGAVYDVELIQRFEIDTLLETYNLLLIAILAGYVPPELDEHLSDEITTILSHPSVKPYFKKYYRYKLTEYTLQYVSGKKYFTEIEPDSNISALNAFIALNRMLDHDEDLEVFMAMLDFVQYGNDSLDDVIEILSSYEKLNHAFTAKHKTEEIKSVWGFFKYTTFLSQLREVIESVDDNPLLQSAMWLYHGYHLDRLNSKMRSLFTTAFRNLSKVLASPAVFKNLTSEFSGHDKANDYDEAELKETANMIVQKSKEDVLFILDPKWKLPMKKYFEHK
jgi:hypothetical protein